jgi:hypothetical protein
MLTWTGEDSHCQGDGSTRQQRHSATPLFRHALPPSRGMLSASGCFPFVEVEATHSTQHETPEERPTLVTTQEAMSPLIFIEPDARQKLAILSAEATVEATSIPAVASVQAGDSSARGLHLYRQKGRRRNDTPVQGATNQRMPLFLSLLLHLVRRAAFTHHFQTR